MLISRGRLTLSATGVLVAVLALGGLSAPGYADDPVPEPGVTDAPATGATAAAVDALDDVEALLDPTPAALADARTTGSELTTDDGRDLTLALRDLRLRQADLPKDDRARAARLLTRPPDAAAEDWDDPQEQRYGPVLVHWDNGTVSQTYRDQVGAVAKHVLATYKAAGYRAPEPDTRGGSTLLDVYISDLGVGLYGYCNTDQTPPSRGPYDTSAYCSFSSDYSWASSRTPLENLKVTAAHELFHATQFAYDYFEDAWFMEATAAWAEDEVYDAINDNRQYLASSPMRQPRQPLDQFSRNTLRQYGEWIFFRYLTERFPRAQGGLPVIMRRLWERVDASRGGPDDYSIRAVSRELATHGTDLRHVYAQFGDANRRPGRVYREGRFYRPAPASKAWTLTPRSSDTHWQRLVVNHLATGTVQVTPGSGMRGRRLRVELDLPPTASGVAAVVTRYDSRGRPRTKFVRLSKAGNGSVAVSFDTRSTSRVDLTLSNAGIRYRDCWTGPARNGVSYSCSGRSMDDHRVLRYRVSAVR